MPTTIKSKLRLIVVMTTGIALFCAFSILIWHDNRDFKNKFINDLRALAHLVGSNSNASLLFHDNDSAYLTLKTLEAQTHIQRAIIFDLNNKVFADHTGTQINNTVPDPAKVATGIHFYGEQLAVVTDISFDEEVIGRLYLLADFNLVKERLIEYSILSINILWMSLFIAYLFGNRLIQSIINPIFGLATLAESISEKNDMSVRADKQDIYELSLLANSFNQMLDDIESSHTNLQASEQRLSHLASHDALTGLPNRRLLIDRLEHSILIAKRTSKGLAVIFFDLDRFKQINDTLGHEAGDELLVQTSKRLKAVVRESDTVSRMGGDEFVLILEDIDKPNSVAVVARNIVQQFEAPFTASGNEIRVTPSLGICVYPDNGDNSEELIKNADTAMFSAKNLGRNNYQFYTPEMNEKAQGRLAMENHLRVALERNELSLYYQPKIDCRTQQIIGAEALLRWHHPELGFVSPGDFIPMAEETGLIVPIGQWVLEQACRDAKSWQQSGLPFCPVAVNISPLQFRSTDLPLLVGSTLEKYELDPGSLELELTESLIMDTPEKIILHLQVLKNIGIKISIDDFGTGYSSLSYLQKFPIDTLKIDQSFVSDIDVATQESPITKAIIAMAHSLNLNVIAEGVETLGQLEFLQNLGCYQIQGFLFSKPIPQSEFIALLQSQSQSQTSGLG